MGTQYLIDSNIVIGYLSGTLPVKGMQFMDEIVDAIPQVSVITKIETLGYNTLPAVHQILTDFMNDAIVIDVGISRVETNEAKASKIVGDVDFQDVFGYVRALTPVPGGVGPMTIIYLLVNCLRAAQIAKHVNN